jgi:hypothetical protein
MSDSLTRLLAALPPAAPDPVRADRIRVRCRARLERASASQVFRPRGTAPQIWQPLIAILGGVYLTEVIVLALRLYGLP